ncbi:DUF5995 family protein [Kitasatospora sp. NPDC057512]|uniref:DUF5995 family protein n=1 Tax=Kitasatospora sp. NPDC057512 TaxID=3346154 RepID=UPI0036B1CCB9
MPDTAVDRTTAVVAEARTVEQVVGRLREIGAGLPPADGVGVFNRLYLTVTEAVRDRLDGGCFTDPSAVAELDVVFAGRYLRAVAADAAGQEPPACWRPLFALRAHPGVHPLQFALAGMAAHIQHDLPLAVVDTCRRRGCEPSDVEPDYHRIDRVLAEVETAVREQLMPGPDLLERAEPLTHLLGAWSVGAAREGAWGTVEALWELRHLPGAARALATALDGSVGLLGRVLLLPLGPAGRHGGGPGDERSTGSGHAPDHTPNHAPDDRPARGRVSGRISGPTPGHRTPATAAAARLPEARNRTADGAGPDGTRPDAAGPAAAGPEGAAEGAAVAAGAGGGQAQLECSGLPSA